MKKIVIKVVQALVLALALHVFAAPTFSQDVVSGAKDFRIVFEEIQYGFEMGKVSMFSSYLGSQVQVALKGQESGYYSSNHAYYILEDFVKIRKVVSFEFTSVGETDAMPYATGRAVFINKGTREITQVYVALMKSGDKWVVAEINIY